MVEHVEAGQPPAGDATKYAAIGGVIGAIAASTCCILPLAFFSLGISGAWIGQLTALAPYQPFILVLTAGSLGYGYWTVYRARKNCSGDACARPLPGRLVMGALLGSTALVVLALLWPYLLPLIVAI